MNTDNLAPSANTTTKTTSNGTSQQHNEEESRITNTNVSATDSEENRSTAKVKSSECDYQSILHIFINE